MRRPLVSVCLFPPWKLTKNDFPAENSVVCLVGQVKEQDVGKP